MKILKEATIVNNRFGVDERMNLYYLGEEPFSGKEKWIEIGSSEFYDDGHDTYITFPSLSEMAQFVKEFGSFLPFK